VYYLIIHQLNMFRESLCPSSGACITAYGFQHMMCWLGYWEAEKQSAYSAHGLLPGFPSNIWPCALDDGHNDARNMLS